MDNRRISGLTMVAGTSHPSTAAHWSSIAHVPATQVKSQLHRH